LAIINLTRYDIVASALHSSTNLTLKKFSDNAEYGGNASALHDAVIITIVNKTSGP